MGIGVEADEVHGPGIEAKVTRTVLKSELRSTRKGPRNEQGAGEVSDNRDAGEEERGVRGATLKL